MRKVRFIEQILVYKAKHDSKIVIHVVDEGIQFSAERVFEAKTINTVRKSLLKCLLAIYTDLANTNHVS